MKNLIILILTLSFLGSVEAQEWRIALSGPLSSMGYKPSNSNSKLMAGGELGTNYTFLFGKHFGIMTGVEAGIYKGRTQLNDGTMSTNMIDDQGSAFVYKVSTKGYEETYQMTALSIPFMLRFRTNLTIDTYWYLDAGVKWFMPSSLIIHAKDSSMNTSGYYPNWNVEFNNVPNHGFSTTNNWKGNREEALQMGLMGSVSSGFGFPLGGDWTKILYVGFFANFGVQDFWKTSGTTGALVSYEPNGAMPQANGLHNTASGKVPLQPFSFGITLKLGWDFSKKAKQKGKLNEAPKENHKPISQPKK
ncbi:MAG: hypothetical protein JST58_00470 [Bacteroidetes bacterium]|nr:hypothetical protein [Bacteroidota bacterium]